MKSSDSQCSNDNGVYDESTDSNRDNLASAATVEDVAVTLTSQSLEAETILAIQVHIIILLHADKCLRDPDGNQCYLPYCSMMKDLIFHMDTCQAGIYCAIPECCSSARNIFHWNNCKNIVCPICVPLKEEMALREAGF